MRATAIALALVSPAFVWCAVARATDASDFYRGKQISLLVNFTTGGPTDTEARLLARHLSKHIPGNPGIVVRNMAGAGGALGANWLGQVAPRDGLTIGYLTGVAVAAAEGTPSLKIDPTKMPFIAGVESISVYYGRTDTGGGLREPQELVRKSGFWAGGLTPDSSKDISLRAELDLLGLNYKYISGYPGAAEVRMALEQNEVQITSESLPSFSVSIKPALIDTGRAIALWYDTSAQFSQTGDPDAAATKALPFPMFYRKVKGAPPDSELWRMNEIVSELSTSLLRTIQMAPETPPEAVGLVRQAVLELPNDPEYRADALQVLKYVPRFNSGPAAEKNFIRSVALESSMKAFLQAYIAKGYALVGK